MPLISAEFLQKLAKVEKAIHVSGFVLLVSAFHDCKSDMKS